MRFGDPPEVLIENCGCGGRQWLVIARTALRDEVLSEHRWLWTARWARWLRERHIDHVYGGGTEV